jgi:hypothetical protein
MFSVSTLYLYLIYSPSFTATAIVSSGIAAGAIMAYMVNQIKKPLELALPVLVLTLGISWRFESLAPVGIFSVFLCFSFFTLTRHRIGEFLKLIARFLVVTGGSFVAVVSANSICVDSRTDLCRDWENWNRYNEIRASLHGTPRGLEVSYNALAGNSEVWTGDQAQQFEWWMYFDPKVHGFDSVVAANSEIPQSVGFSGVTTLLNLDVFLETLFGLASRISSEFADKGHWVVIMLAITVSALVMRRQVRYGGLFVIVLVSLGPLASMFLASLIRLPEAVLTSLVGLWMVGLFFTNYIANQIPIENLRSSITTNTKSRYLTAVLLVTILMIVTMWFAFVNQSWVFLLLVLL